MVPLCGAQASMVGVNGQVSTAQSFLSWSRSTLPALADGCYHVFLDVGSNLGVHGRFLFEPEKYPLAHFTKLFDEQFGPNRKKIPICVFAFEPNPRHKAHQQATEKAYQRMGWRYHYIQAAVSDQAGSLTFYRNGHVAEGFENEEWGFSLVPTGNLTEAIEQAVTVQTVDLAQWFKDNIQFRRLPTIDSSLTLGKPPTIMMKMDIESAEFRTLPHLALTGVACQIDKLIGEAHVHWPEPVMTRGLNLTSSELKQELLKSVAMVMQAEGCKPMYEQDDESYLHDGSPLPLS